MRSSPLFATIALLASTAACAGPSTDAEPPPPPPSTEPGPTSIDAVLDRLVAEALGVQRELKISRLAADFAARDGTPPPPPEAVSAALRRPVHRDPFVDGYVRWQLTSYDPPLGSFTDEQFEAFTRTAPRLLDNPRAGRRLVRFAAHMLQAGPLPDRDRELVELRLADTDAQSELVAAFFPLADRFRLWVDQRLADQPDRRITWRLEHAAATARAGWPPDRVVARIDELVSTDGPVATLTEAQREAITTRARTLPTIERTMAVDMRLTDEGVVEGRLVEVRIDEATVDRWLSRLSPPNPQPSIPNAPVYDPP